MRRRSIRGGLIPFLILAAGGCMSADEKANRAVLLESELHLTDLGISQMRNRLDSMSMERKPDSVSIRALTDTILKWRVDGEKLAAELRALRK